MSAKRNWPPFEEAREIVRKDFKKYKINDVKGWYWYCKSNKRPKNIPASPWIIYKDSGWVDWFHWLGKEKVYSKKIFLSFNEALKVIRKDSIKYKLTYLTWKEYSKNYRPVNIPSNPHITYKNKGWISWKHWLRTDNIPENKKLSVCFPELIKKYWDYDNNIKSPDEISYGERTIVNLKCDKDHRWPVHAYSLKDIKGCPYCLHKKIIREESFGYKYPHLLRHWDYTKNIIDPYEIYPKSGKTVWLKCSQNHTWTKRLDHIVNRGRGDDCPYCNHELPSKEYNAAILYPELLKDWHPDNKCKLEDFLPSSSKKVKWKCHICNYEWIIRIAERARNEALCPACRRIHLKDGTLCDSLIEAYYCLLLKQSEMEFSLNHRYPGLKLRYDFYIPSLNLYIETTSFNDKMDLWEKY